jgi:superfamily I DNA and/or RNA helicase
MSCLLRLENGQKHQATADANLHSLIQNLSEAVASRKNIDEVRGRLRKSMENFIPVFTMLPPVSELQLLKYP